MRRSYRGSCSRDWQVFMENKNLSVDGPINCDGLDEASFEALMSQIAGGSEEAVWALLDRYTRNLVRAVRRRLPHEIRTKLDSMDIVQSVWKSFLRGGARPPENASVEQFAAYLFGMARLKTLEKHRRYTRHAKFDIRREQPLGTIKGANPEGRNDQHCTDYRHESPSTVAEIRDDWKQALCKVGDRGRQVVQLRLQGLTLDEVAQRMAISKSTVRRILDSMLQSLTA